MSPSPADLELIAAASGLGVTVTARQLERWRAAGLLLPNRRVYLGRGRGSSSMPAVGAVDLVVWLVRHAGPGRRPHDLALEAFAVGLPIPESTVRRAFDQVVARMRLPGEAVPDSDPDHVIDSAVAAGLRGTLIPRRVRRIDQRVAALGLPWAPPELAAFDRGPAAPPLTAANSTHIALEAVSGHITTADMGAYARAIMPAGAIAPAASDLEYGFADSEAETTRLLNDDGGLAFLPSGDLRSQLRDLAQSTPLDDLLEAWRLAAHLPQWATNLCTAIEKELEAGQPGEAIKEWWLGAFGPPRGWLIVALRSTRRPADIALNALLIVFRRNMIIVLRPIMPDGQFHLLTDPMLTPPFLVPFMSQVSDVTVPSSS